MRQITKKAFTPNQIYSWLCHTNQKFIWHYKLCIKNKLCRKFGSGFTLIELMLVVVILGILVAMVVPRLAGRSEQARKAAAKTDIEANISLALDMYELDNGAYPGGLDVLVNKPSSGSENWKGPYLKKKPIDPWAREYIYKSPGAHNKDYDLYSLGSDGAEGGGDDVTNWDEEGKTSE